MAAHNYSEQTGIFEMPEKQLKIAFVDYVLEPDKPGRSGLSDIVWDMASELVNQGHEAHVIGSYYTTTYPDPRVIVHNFPTPPIGYRNIIGQLWILKRAADVVRNLQPDVVHAPEYLSTAVLSVLGICTPLVVTVPGNIYHRIKYGHSFEWSYVQVLKLAAKRSARHCASIIAVSREMKRWWEWTGSTPERTAYIPYGVNEARFHYVPDARVQLGIDSKKLFLVYAGRFASEKGLLDLVNALVLIRAELKPGQFEVVLIGKGPQEQEIRQRISQEQLEPFVCIQPWVAPDELPLWYSAADALLLPSHSEAFSRTILEAMICGTPVIGSRITGTEDHVHDGQNGFLFPAKDAQALSKIIERCIKDYGLLRSVRKTTLRYAEENLAWYRIVGRIIKEVYQPLLKHSRSRMNAVAKVVED